MRTKTYFSAMLGFCHFPSSEHTGYRFGFNGMEKDDEVKGNGNSLDFGARIFDPRIARFLSTDPLAGDFAHLTPYQYANNSPIYFIDAEGKSGKAYKTDHINEKTGRPILRVKSNVFIYGEAATATRRDAIKTDLNGQYNNGGEFFTFTDDAGTTYDVVFEFDVQIIDEADVNAGIGELNPENNYYGIDNGNESFTLTGRSGGNTGILATDDLDANQSTAAHEMNHSFGGEKHPADKLEEGGVVDIPLPKDHQYQDGTTIDPTKRKVTQENINTILKGVTFDKNGEGNVGNPRPQRATRENSDKYIDVRE